MATRTPADTRTPPECSEAQSVAHPTCQPSMQQSQGDPPIPPAIPPTDDAGTSRGYWHNTHVSDEGPDSEKNFRYNVSKPPGTVIGATFNKLVADSRLRGRSWFTIFDFDPEEVARQMTIIDFTLFLKIKPCELLNQDRPYNFEEVPALHENLTRFHFLDTDVLYDVSLQREPRDKGK